MIEKEIWQRRRDKGLNVFAIGVKEMAEQAPAWSSQHHLTYPVMIDPEGEIFRKYGNGSVPYHVLIDRDFKIIHSEEIFKKELLIGIINDVLKED